MEHQGIWFYTSFHSQHLLACLVHGRCPIKSISMGVFFFLGLYFSQYTIHRFSHQLTQAPPHRYWVCKKEKSGSVAQSCPTLCDPIGCSPPGFSVHGILQARILESVAPPFSGCCSLRGLITFLIHTYSQIPEPHYLSFSFSGEQEYVEVATQKALGSYRSEDSQHKRNG